MTLFDLLDRAVRTQEALRFMSVEDGKPHEHSSPRRVSSFDTKRVVVERVDGDGTRNLSLKYLLQVADSDGNVWEWPEGHKQLEQIQARRRERAALIEGLRASPLTELGDGSVQVVHELDGTEVDAPRKFYVLRARRSGRLAVVRTADSAAAERLCRLLSTDLSVWEVADSVLDCEFYWPVWTRMHAEDLDAADIVRGQLPRIRDSDAAFNDKGVRQGDHERAQVYAAAEHAFTYQDPDYLEADAIDYLAWFEVAKGALGSAMRTYLAKGWNSAQFHDRATHIESSSDRDALRRAGLLVPADAAPAEALLRCASAGVLNAPLKARGIKVTPVGRDGLQRYLAKNITPEFEAEMRQHPWLKPRDAFLPPKGFTWEQVQDFRFAYPTMIRDLQSWLNDTSERTEPPLFARDLV